MFLAGLLQDFNLFSGFSDVINQIKSYFQTFAGVFDDIDFTILYNWLPADIVAVITAVLGVLLFLAIFGLLRRVLFFIG